MGASAGSGYRFGQFVLNRDRGCLQKGGVDLNLRPKAFEVLRYLVEHAGRLASKDELVAAVWPNVIVNDDALAQCIRDIRKVLNDENEQFIRTVPRRGYMFVAETVPIAEASKPIRSDAAITAPVPQRRVWIAAAVAAFALASAAFAAWSIGWFERHPQVTDTRLTIAVLPFTAAAGEEYLGDGIAEDIMTAVSRFRDLTVIARNSSSRYRGDAVDLRQAGKELNAHYILQGSVRRSGDRLRITAQLVDPRTGTTHWTERYDRPFADVFAIQDEIADKVAAQLVLHAREATGTRLQARAPANLEVYELALRGRKAYVTFTREGAIEARALAERAIAIDPNYAAAWEVLANALLQFYIQPYGEQQGSPAMLQQARAAAAKAVSLDGNFATAQATLGFVLIWAREYEASLETLRKAVDLNPNDPIAHVSYGMALFSAGFSRESIKAYERAERYDPFFPPIRLAMKAQPYIMLREFEPALRLTRSCMERAPRLVACSIHLAIAAKELGLEDEARGAARRLLEIASNFTINRRMRLLPLRREADAAQYAEYLRRAGLPE